MPALVSSHMHDRFHVQASCSSLSLVSQCSPVSVALVSSCLCFGSLNAILNKVLVSTRLLLGSLVSTSTQSVSPDGDRMILLLWLLQADFSAYISFYTSLSRIIIKCYKYCFLLTWAAQTVETLQPLFIHLYEGAAPDTSLRVKPKIFWFLVSSFETLQRQKRTTPLAVASEELLMLQCYNTPVAALCRTFPPGSQERLCMV